MLNPNVLRSLFTSLREVEFKWWEPLARYTTFRIGGPVACLARPRTEEALIRLMGELRAHQVPYFVLGGGSNLLLPDGELNALAIQLEECSSTIVLGSEPGASGGELSVGAGVRLSRLLRYCLKKELGGLEFLVGIPGTVGGALVMNAGTRDGSIADALLWVDVLDENNRRQYIRRSDLTPGYRSMGLSGNLVILGGGFGVVTCTNGSLRARVSELMRHRKNTQPLAEPSAGCIFKNPKGHAAGALIEKAGLKGFRVGDAEVSNRHANWIINRGRARAQDVMALIQHIEDRVERDSGIRLEREIRIIGL